LTEFYVKIYRVEEQVLVAACDSELLGRTISGEGGLELRVSEHFYGGSLMDAGQACKAMRTSTSLNLMGEGIVKLALSSGFGHPDCVVRIGDVPHLMLIRI
jgi:hypothetical protein